MTGDRELLSDHDDSFRSLRRAVLRYREEYPDEAATMERFLGLLDEGEPAFTRANLHAHFTGSALIFDARGERTLLTHHAKLHAWLQLGGHADGDIDLHRVATREAVEESGLAPEHLSSVTADIIDLDIHEIPERGETPVHEHFDVRFLFIADPELAVTVSNESHDVKWVALADIPAYSTEESLLRALEKAQRWIAASRRSSNG